jgi:hypothetical protein
LRRCPPEELGLLYSPARSPFSFPILIPLSPTKISFFSRRMCAAPQGVWRGALCKIGVFACTGYFLSCTSSPSKLVCWQIFVLTLFSDPALPSHSPANRCSSLGTRRLCDSVSESQILLLLVPPPQTCISPLTIWILRETASVPSHAITYSSITPHLDIDFLHSFGGFLAATSSSSSSRARNSSQRRKLYPDPHTG